MGCIEAEKVDEGLRGAATVARWMSAALSGKGAEVLDTFLVIGKRVMAR